MKFRTDRRSPMISAVYSAGVEDDEPIGHQKGGKRDVGCDGHVADGGMLHDIAVGHVRPAVDSHGREVRVPRWKLDALVCHQDRRELEALGRPEADFFHLPRGSVGVDPERHAQGRNQVTLDSYLCRKCGYVEFRVATPILD